MKRTTITLKDIARATGVHASTVSRALDPNSRTTLSGELVERIRATAEALGYRRNVIASSLRTQRTMTVGVVLPDISNWIFPPIVRGIECGLEAAGYASIIVNTDNDAAREERLLSVLRERGVDGVIHAAVLHDDPLIVAQAEAGLPVVTLNRRIHGSRIPCVVNDERAGIGMMVAHLVEHGHRRIAAIAGPQALSTGLVRREALLTGLRALGLGAPAGLEVSAGFSEAEGRRCCAALLDGGHAFTAILCANDRLALGALAELAARGIDCPGEVSLTGFNDMPFLDIIPPGLTTVRIEQYDSGRIAAELLVRMLRGEADAVPEETCLPVALIRRGSVGAAARPAQAGAAPA